MTFWYSQNNYGQLLQLFALNKFLSNNGHNPFVIRYDNRDDINISFYTSLKRVIKKIIKSNKRTQNDLVEIENNYFDNFRKNNLKFSSREYFNVKDLKLNPPVADVYICGSDVIWNSAVGNDAYFLNFGQSNIKRIAYAPSFGSNVLPKSYLKKIRKKLPKFDYVGVRESSGVILCAKAGYKNAINVPDPTLLLDVNDYNIIIPKYSPTEDFVLFYLLGKNEIFDLDEIFNFFNTSSISIKYIKGQNRKDCYESELNVTIEKWLAYVKNAKCIITNSYHCCIFAIIFNVKFMYIPLEKDATSLNERIYDLVNKLGLKSRVYSGSIQSIYDDIDWVKVNDIIYQERTKYQKILLNWIS